MFFFILNDIFWKCRNFTTLQNGSYLIFLKKYIHFVNLNIKLYFKVNSNDNYNTLYHLKNFFISLGIMNFGGNHAIRYS